MKVKKQPWKFSFILIIGLFFSFTSSAQFGPSTYLFEGEIQYASSITCGDVDIDGDNDVIIDALPGTFIYRNLGGGLFSKKEKILNSTDFYFTPDDLLKIVDIDNDGDGDFIENNTWFRNNGVGQLFTPMGVYSPAGFLMCTLMKDINGDGFIDDVGGSGAYLYTVLNNGNGTFSIGDTLDSNGVTLNMDCSLKDMNGDQIADLVIGGDNAHLGWYAGTGAGLFGPKNLIAQFVSPYKQETGDMDGDGDNDLIAFGTSGTLLWKNDGAGVFTFYDTIATYVVKPLMIADVDGDNNVDLSVFTSTLCNVTILRSTNGLSWSLYDVELFNGYSLGGVQYDASDMDNDGDLDVVMCSPFGLACWYPNNGNGLIGERKNIVTNALGWGADIDAGDVDLDGDVDLIVASQYGKFVGLFLNNGNGAFADEQLIAENCGRFSQTGFADLNMDGLLDVVTNSVECPVIWNNGGGTWTIDTMPGQIVGPLAFDIDGDTDPDLVGDGKWYQNNGNSTFTLVYDADIPLVYYNYLNQRDNDTADFNNDGFLDYVFSFRSDSVAVMINNGFGDFVSWKFFCYNDDIDVSDMDNNGFADVVVSSGIRIFVYYNDGNGNFVGVSEYQAPGNSGYSPSIHTCDIDEDGDMDVVSSWSAGYSYYNYLNRNKGDGTLAPEDNAPGNSHTSGMLLTDLNNDSRKDYVCLSLNTIITAENFYIFKMKLKGSVFADYNSDAVLDSIEPNVPFHLVKCNANNGIVFTNSAGNYEIGTNSGTFNIWIPITSQYIVTNNPDTLTATVDSLQPVQSGLDFGIYPVADTSALLTLSTSQNIRRCNNDCFVNVDVKNTGVLQLGLSVVELYIHPDIAMNTINFTYLPDSVSGDYYYWHIDTLYWFQNWNVNFGITTGPAGSMSKIIARLIYGSSLSSIYSDSLGGDVACAFDPNDKQVSPAGYGNYGAININTQWLTYTVRFQNTGNDTAFNVVVKDLLDADLNWATLEVLAVSHPVTALSIDQFGLASFEFDQILLPDSNVDEMGSHGFIKYRIQPNSNPPEGTEVNNKAYIYFDENIPVITNNVINTFVDCSLFTCQITKNLSSDSLIATEGEIYQWFLNGVAIPGAVNRAIFIDSIGIYSVQVTNVYGCIATSNSIQITCTNVYNSISAFICSGDSFSIANLYLSTSGVYTFAFINMPECDSIVTLNLSVSDTVGISLSNDTLFATPSGLYQWYDCFNDSIISSATLDYFTPDQNGDYACIINQQGCVDTTNCITVVITSINDLSNSEVSIAANPVTDILSFNGLNNRIFEITIRDASGKLVINDQLTGSQIDVSQLQDGMYLLTLMNLDNIYTLKFIKSRR